VAVAAFNALLQRALAVTGSAAGWQSGEPAAAQADDDGAGW